jgi:hypothetical protein
MRSHDYQSSNVNELLVNNVTLLPTQMLRNTIQDSNGQILTGQIWRQHHGFLKNLPFHTNIPRMEEIAGALQGALGQDRLEKSFIEVLLVSK